MATLERARRWVVILLAVELVALFATGGYLLFFYYPRVGGAPLRVQDAVRQSHLVCAWLAVATALVVLVLSLVSSVTGRQREGRFRLLDVVVGAGLVATVIVGLRTGTRLPWDMFAVRGVTVGTHIAGYGFLRHSNVVFVLAAGVEVSTASVLHRLLVHLLVAGLGSAVLAVAAWVPVRRSMPIAKRRRTRPAPVADPADEEPAAYLD